MIKCPSSCIQLHHPGPATAVHSLTVKSQLCCCVPPADHYTCNFMQIYSDTVQQQIRGILIPVETKVEFTNRTDEKWVVMVA